MCGIIIKILGAGETSDDMAGYRRNTLALLENRTDTKADTKADDDGCKSGDGGDDGGCKEADAKRRRMQKDI